MAEPHVTLDTIARELGVSRMTVSNAYNRPDQLSPALRERVLEAARRLGYGGPNPVASTLRRGRTGTLGVAFDDPLSYAFTDPAAVAFLQGMAGECEREGVGLLIVPGAPSRSASLDLIRTALVDSFAVFCDYEDDPRIQVLRERGLPFVLIDAAPRPGIPSVGVDDRAGARAAAQHLLDLGHRRIGVVSLCFAPDSLEGRLTSAGQTGPGYHVTRQRLEGYRAALEAAAIDWDRLPIYQHAGVPNQGAPDISGAESGYRLAPYLLDQVERPTGILAMSDELARGVLQAAAERGIDVPRDLSVVGFDDTPEAVRARPALTTIRQPLAAKGAAAARLLLAAEPALDVRIELPTQLIVRASTAPAPR